MEDLPFHGFWSIHFLCVRWGKMERDIEPIKLGGLSGMRQREEHPLFTSIFSRCCSCQISSRICELIHTHITCLVPRTVFHYYKYIHVTNKQIKDVFLGTYSEHANFLFLKWVCLSNLKSNNRLVTLMPHACLHIMLYLICILHTFWHVHGIEEQPLMESKMLDRYPILSLGKLVYFFDRKQQRDILIEIRSTKEGWGLLPPKKKLNNKNKKNKKLQCKTYKQAGLRGMPLKTME